MRTDAAPTLRRLLDDGARHGPEYGDGLSSHLPMALLALWRLGADGARLQAFADHYVQTKALPTAPPAAPWPAGDAWQARFGEIAAWPAYRDLFGGWLAAEGTPTVLHAALPPLMRGCGGAAFHGLIRTAYAVQAGHEGELADALAYWACRWMDLGAPVTDGTVADPAKVLAGVAIAPAKAPLIALRMLAAARHRSFAAAAGALRIDAGALPRIARMAARLYARSGNFTVLHLVTSAQALRVLLPVLAQADAAHDAVAAYWRAVVAGYVASRVAVGTLGRAPTVQPWESLAAAAVASDDDHLIKLVDACRLEQQAHGGAPDWQRAATRVAAAGGA